MGNDNYMICITAADQYAKRFTVVLKLLLINGSPCVILLAAGMNLLLYSITHDKIDVERLFLPFNLT